jgi:hypothetical protein
MHVKTAIGQFSYRNSAVVNDFCEFVAGPTHGSVIFWVIAGKHSQGQEKYPNHEQRQRYGKRRREAR